MRMTILGAVPEALQQMRQDTEELGTGAGVTKFFSHEITSWSQKL